MSKIKSIAFILSVLTISFFLSYLVLAWTEPSSAPPTGNVSAPLNVSPTAQTKTGDLTFTVFYDYNGVPGTYYVDPSAPVSALFAGNVGIGTTSPNAKLQIVGSISRQGTTLYGDTTVVASHVNLGTNSTTGLSGLNKWYATIGGGDSNTASGEGSTIGGGYSNTASGDYSTIGGGYSNTAGGNYSWAGGIFMQLSSSANRTFVWGISTSAFNIDTADAFLIDPKNYGIKVGIGTTSPGQKLSVAGTLGIREGGLLPSFYTIFQGGDQSASLTYTLPIAYPSVSGQVLSSTMAGVLSWVTAAGGGAPVGASYVVIGLDATLTAERNLVAGSGLTLTDGGANAAVTLNVGAGTGISVAADTVALANPIKSCGAGTAIQSFDLGVVTAPTCVSTTGLTGGVVNKVAWWNTPTSLSNSTNFHWDSTTERLGIGTTSPNATLDVRPAWAINTDSVIFHSQGTKGLAGYYRVGVGMGGSGEYRYYTYSGSNMLFGYYGDASGSVASQNVFTERMRIDTLGNVGIGTTSPGYKLDVVGDINLGGANVYRRGGTAGVSVTCAAGNTPSGIITSGGIVISAGACIAIGGGGGGWTDDGTVVRLTTSTDNVGIGTTAPNAKLSIANNVATGFLDNYSEYQQILFDGGTAGSSYGFGIKGNTMVFNSGMGAYSFDRAGNATAMVIDTFGNVGIGTTGPSEKLDVVGNAKISGTIRGATYGFGGMFTENYTDATCGITNIFTGACTCPGGFTPRAISSFVGAAPLLLSTKLYVSYYCYK